MFNKLLIFFMAIFLLSCNKIPEYSEVKKTSQALNASLPENLIEELSHNFLKENPEITLDLKKVVNKFGFYNKVVWPIDIKLWPKSTDENIVKHFKVNDGAIRIDINRFVKQIANSDKFYMQLELSTEKFNKLFVYFLPSFKREGKCETFYNVTNFYHENLSQKVLLSKLDDHYIKNYLGTYIFFSVLNEGTYQLNLLQITDSSLGDKVCHFL